MNDDAIHRLPPRGCNPADGGVAGAVYDCEGLTGADRWSDGSRKTTGVRKEQMMPFVTFYPEAVRQQTPTPEQQVCDSREHKPDRSIARFSITPLVYKCPNCGLASVFRIKPVWWQGAQRG